jgi:hypothetical protein
MCSNHQSHNYYVVCVTALMSMDFMADACHMITIFGLMAAIDTR